MQFLNRFIDWKKNRSFRRRMSFSATFLSEVNPRFFLPILKTILFNNLDKYYIHIDENNVIPLNEFHDHDFERIDIITDKSMAIDMIFLRKDSYDFAKNTMISIGLTNDFSINGYEILEKLILNENLFLGNFDEPDYLTWQNCTSLSAYKYRGGLKFTQNGLNEKIVDISTRPGRCVFTKYFRYAGSSKMWFGPQIYQFIPQEKILSFEGAVEIKIIDHNITFVNLYETVYDGDEPQNQDIQRRFREHIGIDTLKIG